MKRRLFPLLSALLLLCGLLTVGAAKEEWDENVVFLVLNDSPVTLAENTMPIRVGGSIYVPYFMFDANQNGGTRLGVFNGGEDKVQNTLTLYDSNSKNLTFDLRTGLSYDYFPDGNLTSPRAVIRNGQVYVSARATANYFGLSCIQTNVVLGEKSYPLVRIRSDQVSLSDSYFQTTAATAFSIQLQNYYRSVMGQGGEPGGVPVEPLPTATAATPGEVRVYLALRCETGAAGEEMLDALLANRVGALLLFPTDALAVQDDLVRRAVGEGHMIGLIVSSADPEEAGEELAEANRLLAHITRASTRIVLAGGEGVADALTEEGWLCWREDLTALPEGRGSGAVYARLINSLEAREGTVRITLDDSDVSAAVLKRLLQALREDRYSVRLAVETEF